MRVLLALLLIGIAGCGGEDTSPGDVATPSSPVKAENAEAGAPKPQVAEPKGSVPSTKPVSPGSEPNVPGGMEVTNSIGMKLRLIPAGEFMMGSPGTESDRGDNETQHRVTLTKPFYMGVTEVTQEQYQKVMGTNPSYFKGPQNPAEKVSWADAVEFCGKLSAMPAEKTAGHVYRLPTEAEWEYACRSGTTTAYGFGDDASRHGEEHVAPHGGTLVELGDHQYHAEIAWDEKAKTITLYVLDGEAEKAVPISAIELVLYVDTDDEGTPYKLVAKPQPGDGDDGKSSRFVTTDKDAFEKYHDDDSARGGIELSIGEKTYEVGVTHEEHDLGDYGWFEGNSDSSTHPVGEKKPNAWGLYDMHGNVWEWCQDRPGNYPSGSATDPTGATSGSRRVDRGGSWDNYDAWYCRSAYRGGYAPEGRSSILGFRVLRSSIK